MIFVNNKSTKSACLPDYIFTEFCDDGKSDLSLESGFDITYWLWLRHRHGENQGQ